MKHNELYHATRKTAWAYILLHVNLNLGMINILPDWWGYLMIVTALPVIGEEEESANLLTPLGIFLTVIEVVNWLNECLFASSLPLYLISIVSGAISLYFHFQFFTNLAAIAKRYGCREEAAIMKLRTVNTVLKTAAIVCSSLQTDHPFMTGLLILLVIVAIFICRVLFSFSNSLEEKLSELSEEVLTND